MSAEDRRERLVDAAIAVMTREGVARATTRAIAAEAEMPLGVFHYAFRSKTELMEMVTQRIARKSKSGIDDAVLAGGAADLQEVTRAGLMAYFEHVVEHPNAHLVPYELTTNALRDPELEGLAAQQYDYYLRENEELLLAAAAVFEVEFVAPLSVVSRWVFSTMDGLALNYLARGHADEARQVVELAASALLGMVRQRGEHPHHEEEATGA